MSATIEDDSEAHDLETIMHSLNKEMQNDTYCLREDNLVECSEEGGKIISVEYVDKQYRLVAEPNANLTLNTNKSKESTTSFAESSSNYLTASQPTKSKVSKIPNSSEGAMVYNNMPIKEEQEQLPDDSTEETNQEIYEFDELEEMSDTGEESQAQAGTLLKLLPLNAENPKSSADGAMLHACLHCTYTAPKRYMLSRHMKTHSDERPYICSVCDRGFKTNHTLNNHINVHLGNKPHACDSCESRFTTPGDLKRHIRYKHTHEKRHKCTECDYATVELSKLRRHIRAHTGERPYQCPHCTYASPDTFKLKRHLRTHTGEKPYQCDICQSRFTQSNSLKSHRLIHSVDDKPVFQCALCPTTCSRKTDLRIHVQKLHYSDTPFPCRRCGKELPDRYSYKMHVKTHEGERCYSCNVCNYKSISIRNLEIHKQVHSSEKPFACEVCGQTFRQRQLLNRHKNLYHTENYIPPPKLQKIHDCPYCVRSFAHKGNMVRHMQVHDKSADNVEDDRQSQNIKIEKLNQGSDEGRYNNDDISMNDDETMNGENYEEYEVIEEADADNIDNYVIIETIKPTTSQGSNNMANPTEAINENDCEFQSIKSIVKLEKGQNDNNKAQTEFVEKIIDEESGEPGFMVVKVLQSDDEMDEEDDNCVIFTNFEHMKSIDKTQSKYSVDADVDNCFGFKTEDDGTSGDIDETVLLNIIEEN